MALLPAALSELLRTGQIRVATRADDGRPLLITRVGIGGDILTEVDRGFATTLDHAQVARHRAAVGGALQPLRRLQRTLGWLVNTAAATIALGGPLAPLGIAWWQGRLDELSSLAWAGAALGSAMVGAALFAAARRLLGAWVRRRLLRRLAAFAQGGQERSARPRGRRAEHADQAGSRHGLTR